MREIRITIFFSSNRTTSKDRTKIQILIKRLRSLEAFSFIIEYNFNNIFANRKCRQETLRLRVKEMSQVLFFD